MFFHLNGCHFEFETVGTATLPADEAHGTAKVVCPAGQQITITSGSCILDTPAQHIAGGGVTFTNKPADAQTPKPYVTVHFNIVRKIKYIHTDANFFCPNTHGFAGEAGSFFSTVLLKGYKDLGNVTVNTPTGQPVQNIQKTAYTRGQSRQSTCAKR